MEDERKEEYCPYCGNDTIIDANMVSYGGVVICNGALHKSPVIARVCTSCGTVARIYATQPDKLLKKEKK